MLWFITGRQTANFLAQSGALIVKLLGGVSSFGPFTVPKKRQRVKHTDCRQDRHWIDAKDKRALHPEIHLCDMMQGLQRHRQRCQRGECTPLHQVISTFSIKLLDSPTPPTK